MRAAYCIWRHSTDFSGRQRELPAAFYRVAGILAGVVISSSAWLLALVVASNAAGFTISTPVLTGVGLAIAALCLICLTPVVTARR